MDKFLAVVIVILAIIAIAQLSRVYDLTRDLRGKREEDISARDNKMNAGLMIVFMIVFFVTAVYQFVVFGDPLPTAASEHGQALDTLLNFNWIIIVAVFFLCNALLFIFAAKYYYKEDRKAYYFPHDNKLEMMWTVVPAIVLAVVIIYGLKTWQDITGRTDRDQTALNIELYAKQFDWMARYGGADSTLGDFNYLMVNSENGTGLITRENLDQQLAIYQTELDTIAQGLLWHRAVCEADAKRQNILLALDKINTYNLPDNHHALVGLKAHYLHLAHDSHAADAGHDAHADDAHGDEHGDGHDAGHTEEAHGGGHGHGEPPLEQVGDIQPYIIQYFKDSVHGLHNLQKELAEAEAAYTENSNLMLHARQDIKQMLSSKGLAYAQGKHANDKIFMARLKGISARFDAGRYVDGSDDVITSGEFYVPVGREINFQMRSQDVIHSAYMPHFRAQMNCVPGMTTPFRFTPTITTDSMRTMLDDPEFEYILLCNKICGASHFNMKMKIKVVSEVEFDKWMKKQAPFRGEAVETAQAEEPVKEITVAEVPAAGEPVEVLETAVHN